MWNDIREGLVLIFVILTCITFILTAVEIVLNMGFEAITFIACYAFLRLFWKVNKEEMVK